MKTCKSCSGCKNYPFCVTLCAEARKYVSQDEVPLRELPIGKPAFTQPYLNSPQKKTLSASEKKVGMLLVNNVDREVISQVLGISQKTLTNKISEMRNK